MEDISDQYEDRKRHYNAQYEHDGQIINIGVFPSEFMAATARYIMILRHDLVNMSTTKVRKVPSEKNMKPKAEKVPKHIARREDYTGVRDISDQYSEGKHFVASYETEVGTISVGTYPSAKIAAQNLYKAKHNQKYLGGERSLLNDVRNFPGIRDVGKKNKVDDRFAAYIRRRKHPVFVGKYPTILLAVESQAVAERDVPIDYDGWSISKKIKGESKRKEKKVKTGYSGITGIVTGNDKKDVSTYQVTYRDKKTKKNIYLGRFATLETALDSREKAELGEYIKPDVLNKLVKSTKYPEVFDVSYQYLSATDTHYYVRLIYGKHRYNIGVFTSLKDAYNARQKVKKALDMKRTKLK
ncbi:hypothetical protein EFP00_01835 [Lactiplantibacillus paraplantarum]|uniref:hypothetical protein n=1 Tax=Lactiplantibacillus paraplantarum TaxID=60520 RepID=UPI0021A6DA83|nr:hypothetical protein [Lactiplantibacillus paraplantarum]MCT4456185.1 hypothetical protein [Lactiplantibacillus paraplantarum]